MRTLIVKQKDLKHDLSVYPNFSSSGSIKGMKKLYYGLNALLIKSGSYIYKVDEDVYNFYLNPQNKKYYIRNVISDKNYDEIEDKFYNNNWEPQYNNDKLYLLNLVNSDRDKFKNCIVETV